MSERGSGYPILLHLEDKQVAVIGGGKVAERKVGQLLRSGARILLISPDASPVLQSLAAAGEIEWMTERYRRDMLNDAMPILVIAATDDERVNQTVAQDAQRIRALCNVASCNGEDSDFSNMALVEQPPLTIALSSNGRSPALLRLLKERLAGEIGEEYALLADWLGEIRLSLAEDIESQRRRRQLYQRILDSEVLALLRAGKREEARQTLQEIVSAGKRLEGKSL